MGRLEDLDLTLQLSKKEETRRLEAAWERLEMLRLQLGGHLDGRLGPPLLVVFEGWDAAGKGGCIKRLVHPFDPRHYSVYSISAPTSREKRHHFLWRFWPRLPGDGGMVVFDRSWYGRVLVERVEGFASEAEWRRGYREIADFERSLADEGAIVSKFWLHISDEEQLRRFESRRLDPTKRFKLTDEDWRNRDKRSQYEAAVEEMIAETNKTHAPWHLIPAESKRWARVAVCEQMVADIEAGLTLRGHPVPPSVEEATEALLADPRERDDP